MIKKKFKVRVRHFSEDGYVVEYSYHWLFPCYEPVCFFYYGEHGGSWMEMLFFSLDEAHKFTYYFLRSYSDVEKWYFKQREIEENYIKSRLN